MKKFLFLIAAFGFVSCSGGIELMEQIDGEIQGALDKIAVPVVALPQAFCGSIQQAGWEKTAQLAFLTTSAVAVVGTAYTALYTPRVVSTVFPKIIAMYLLKPTVQKASKFVLGAFAVASTNYLVKDVIPYRISGTVTSEDTNSSALYSLLGRGLDGRNKLQHGVYRFCSFASMAALALMLYRNKLSIY